MIDDLYRRVILDHYQHPAHRRPLENANLHRFAHNPLCGDELTIAALVADGQIADAAFEARACSIVHASADMMVELIKGRTPLGTSQLIAAFEAMMTEDEPALTPELGDLQALRSVRKYPVRVKCALLPWTTLRDALEGWPTHPPI